MVLLKNEGNLLPLAKTAKSIALIGPLADHRKVMMGTWSTGAKSEDAVTLLEGLKKAVGDGCKINYAAGCDTGWQLDERLRRRHRSRQQCRHCSASCRGKRKTQRRIAQPRQH